MTEGFLHLGWREVLAVSMAVAIIVDWAAWRYTRFKPDEVPRRERDA